MMKFAVKLVTVVWFFAGGAAQAGWNDLFCDDSGCEQTIQVAQLANQANPSTMPKNTVQVPQAKPESCVVVKGSAPTKDVDQAFARKMAIRDALEQASLKNNVSIKSDQSVENYQLTLNSTRFTSHSKVKTFNVLEEGFEDPEDMYGQAKKGPLNYEVTVEACLTEERGVCTNLMGNQYQVRLAIAPVVFEHAAQANDISNLLNGYQLELERRLRNEGYQNYVMYDQAIDIQPNQQVRPNLDPEVLRTVREQTGAQYVLLTALRSMSSHVEDRGLKTHIKRYYDLEVMPDSRYIEADWYVVDLVNNKLVYQNRGGFDVKGDVWVGRDKPFGSNGFFATNTGKVFHALLDKQVNETFDYVHCKPFQSEVIDVRDGQYIILLSENSGAKVGDDLAVYHKTGRPIRFAGQDLGLDMQPGAFLKITRIMSKFAVAELVVNKQVVQVGDIVKAW